MEHVSGFDLLSTRSGYVAEYYTKIIVDRFKF